MCVGGGGGGGGTMCKGLAQSKRHTCVLSSDFRYRWKIRQVHNFVHGT